MDTRSTDSESWKHVRSALEEAFALESGERDQFMKALAERDLQLAASVQTLLDRDAESSIDEEAPRDIWNQLFDTPSLAPGTRLGAYKISEAIASGGMGTVYRAERSDQEFDKAVAIKLIKRGMDSEDVLRRFRYERQVLADLEHPGIARLLDGGASEDGQPFFVMEYIEGCPIDQWCDQRRLSVRERLELFQKVCHAVHYAHQRLVVHRDLKPSNILVTEHGTPKLLDFGVARMLNPDTEAERSRVSADRGFFGTPSFASPEQLRGERVTTASDVYTLGIVLYRLLSGKRPYELSKLSQAEVQRIVCEVEPTKPSRLLDEATDSHSRRMRIRLQGDLDNIVLMALRKEPERRYTSAEQFAEDVQRHLDGLPVLARPNTFAYRTSKFLKRNRAATLIGIALVASLVAGIVNSSRLYRDATEAKELAEQRLEDSRRLAATFIFDVSSEIGPLEGTVQARERIVRSALVYLDELATGLSEDEGVAFDLANAYLRLGDLQGSAITSNLGQEDKAHESYTKALEIARTLVSKDSESNAYADLLARSLFRIADLELMAGDVSGFDSRFEHALSLSPADSPDRAVRSTRSRILMRAGDRYVKFGQPDRARTLYMESVGIQEGLKSEFPDSPELRRELATACSKLSEAFLYAGELEGAEALCQQACEELLALFESESEDSEARFLLISAHFQLGTIYVRSERYKEALTPLNFALEHARQTVEADPGNQLAARNRIAGMHMLSAALSKLGDHDQTLAVLLETKAATEALLALDPLSAHTRRDYAICCSNLAAIYLQRSQLAESNQYNEAALDAFRALNLASPESAETNRDLAACLTTVGGYHMNQGKSESVPIEARQGHAIRATDCFKEALSKLSYLESKQQLAKLDEPFLEMLSRFVKDAEELTSLLTNSN